MSIKAKLIIDGKEVNVLSYDYGFRQPANSNGFPAERTVFSGLNLVIETKDINDGEEITFKLYEQDKNIFMRDFLDLDDDKFPEEEVIKKAKVHNNEATIELVLQESWESMIVDDSNNAFSLDEKLELYWKVSYNTTTKELPSKDSDYLRVSFSDRTLYFKTPSPNYNLPEFISYDGDPMLLMEFGKKLIKDKIKKKTLDAATQKAQGLTRKIAFTKLKKGYMECNSNCYYNIVSKH